MFTLIVLNLLISTETFGQISNVILYDGQTVSLSNPGYPAVAINQHRTLEWNFEARAENSRIRVICEDLRMFQNKPWTSECSEVYVSFIEGNSMTKICEMNKSGYKYESRGSVLNVTFSTNNGGGYINCKVNSFKSGPPLNFVQLKPNEAAKVLRLPRKSVSENADHGWIIRSEPGSTIKLQCSLNFGSVIKPCDKDVLIINDGDQTVKYCNTEEITLYSRTNAANIRIQLSETKKKSFQCKVEAIVPVKQPSSTTTVRTTIRVTRTTTTTMATTPSTTTSEPLGSLEYGLTRGRKNTTCDCGRTNKLKSRIVNGTQASNNEYPWVVLYHTQFPHSVGYVTFQSCGGSIITQRHILTAAHCLYSRNGTLAKPENVVITLAEHHRRIVSGLEVWITAKELYIHEYYQQYGFKDIAIIFTNETIQYSKVVSPVCLTPVHLPDQNNRVYIMGWGQIDSGDPSGRSSDVLLKAKTTVIEDCYLPEWEACTASHPTSACYGDSGGPLVVVDPETNRYTQVFLVSRGLKCSYSVNMQTDLIYFFDWIQDIIKRSDASQMICQKKN